jgi:hypothetical protein
MNKLDFFSNLIVHSKEEGFSFIISDEEFDDPKKLSAEKQIAYRAAFTVATSIISSLVGLNYRFMIIGGLNTSQLSPSDKEALIADLKKVHSYCDFIGIKADTGPCFLRLGIDGDDMPDETLIGRCAIIHELANNFRKYSTSLVTGRDNYIVSAQVVIVFSSHKRAKDFIQLYADKCSNSSFWKKIYTYPWIVDLEDEEIKRYGQPLDRLSGHKEKIRASLFRK